MKVEMVMVMVMIMTLILAVETITNEELLQSSLQNIHNY